MEERVMIHACPQRMWYVNDFLAPSLRAQGLDVEIWLDDRNLGCLDSCMLSFREVGKRRGATWHLQDDVLVCRDFADRIREYRDGVVCGMYFSAFGPSEQYVGRVPACFMWNSFPCIRIPNEIAGECSEWFYNDARFRPEYQGYVKSRKKDDTLWSAFYVERHANDYVTNVKPNLAEHVDWLIGGSVINQWRGFIARAKFWDDAALVEELKVKLARR